MPRPENIGILAMEMYMPKRFVSQQDLEVFDNCLGKYTVGLNQINMAFVDDKEDINSILMTAAKSLLEKYQIDSSTIGRLEVGTETQIDKAKSSKTSLIDILDIGGSDIEGVTSVNACYGGTAALFNSIAWIESSEWDGRYALVICGDIAVYEAGPARITGGCGALAILIGPDAPFAIEPGVRSSHTLNIYDFYKPLHSEYPLVDGRLSQWAYLSSVDSCYKRYKAKYQLKHGQDNVNVDHFDFFAFHSPYNKLVQKGFIRLLYQDYLAQNETNITEEFMSVPSSMKEMPLEESYDNREVENMFKNLSKERFNQKVLPACQLNRNIGNCYTGSVFSSILSTICDQGANLLDKRVLVFSYGSGSIASIYSFIGRRCSNALSLFSLERIQKTSDAINRLKLRQQCQVTDFISALDLRAVQYGKAPYIPNETSEDYFFPGTYYLSEINEKHHRTYKRTPL